MFPENLMNTKCNVSKVFSINFICNAAQLNVTRLKWLVVKVCELELS